MVERLSGHFKLHWYANVRQPFCPLAKIICGNFWSSHLEGCDVYFNRHISNSFLFGAFLSQALRDQWLICRSKSITPAQVNKVGLFQKILGPGAPVHDNLPGEFQALLPGGDMFNPKTGWLTNWDQYSHGWLTSFVELESEWSGFPPQKLPDLPAISNQMPSKPRKSFDQALFQALETIYEEHRVA